jgi:hypothetical protein
MVALLPYIEQKSLFDNYKYFGSVQNAANNNYAQTDNNTRYGGSMNLPVTRTQVAAYTCPSDSISTAASLMSGVAFFNYAGNFGNTTRAQTSPYGVDSAGNPNRFGGAPFIEVMATTSNLQVIRLSEVFDGLSNTLLFSETVQGKGGDLRGFGWWRGGCHFETYLTPNSNSPDVMEQAAYCVPTIALNPPCTAPTTANPTCIAARSRHSGGVQITLCDGSGRFVSNSIQLDTWRWLGSMQGKESLGDF